MELSSYELDNVDKLMECHTGSIKLAVKSSWSDDSVKKVLTVGKCILYCLVFLDLHYFILQAHMLEGGRRNIICRYSQIYQVPPERLIVQWKCVS